VNPALVIFLKELKETLRDKRTVIGAFVVPVFLIMLMTNLMTSLEKAVGDEARIELTVVGSQDNPLVQKLKESNRATIEVSSDLEKAKDRLRKGRTGLVLEFKDVVLGEQIQARAFYDGQKPLSLAAFAGIRQAVAEANRQALTQVLTNQGLDASKAEAMKLESEDVAKDKGVASGTWVSLIPYLIILWAFYGGFSMVSDLVAGEKERKTMETLLLSPIPRSAVVIGKYGALFVVCLLSGLMSLVGLALAGLQSGGGGGVTIGPGPLLAFVVVLLPLVALYSGVLLSVSALAKTMREAQTYLTVVSFLVMTPAISSQFVGFTGADRTEWVQWTPILNTAIVMTQALRDQIDWTLVGKAALVSLVLAAAAAYACVRIFSRETILQRT
jgi:sodium transport system permease protein